MSRKTRIALLGAGRVGAAMALDLAADPGLEVVVADRDERALAPLAARGLAVRQADLGGPGLDEILAACDLAVGAVPGYLGFATARRVIEAGRGLVDISFFPEDAFALDVLARERGVTALVDCGVAPGLSNLLLGAVAAQMERVERFTCYVGGLPEHPQPPWEYKAPFSPVDVLEEYTRPARYVRGGRIVTEPALAGLEWREFPGIGSLEAFLTDGLRSLLTTMPQIPEMRELTLRYPGHVAKVQLLRDSGFLSSEALEVSGTRVRPVDLALRLLLPHWEFAPGEPDLTVFEVIVEGVEKGGRVRRVFFFLDRFDTATGTLSMARTTGYTCTAIVRLVARGLFHRPGIHPPEHLATAPGCVDFVLGELAARGIRLAERRESLPPAATHSSSR